jgi:hypothetical protein
MPGLARIEDFASFKSKHLGALRQPTDPSPKLFLRFLPHLKKESTYGHGY